MDRNIIGPTLPPGLKLENNSSDNSDSQDAAIGPSLPKTHESRTSIGPSLPPVISANQSSSNNECGPNVIGPSLPPGFKTVNDSSSSDEDAIGPSLAPGLNIANQNSSSEDENVIGPVIPGRCASKIEKSKSIGPQLPSSSGKDDSGANDMSDNGSEDDDSYMGPALPPGFIIKKSEPTVKGPSLPPTAYHAYAAQSKGVNPDSDEEDFNVVGPLPAEMARGEDQSSVAEEFEKRANSMKDKLTNKDEDVPLARESWMLELPPEMGTNFGLSARKFRTKPSTTKGEDRSCWTDTPADRARKEQEGKSGKGKSSRSDDSRVMSVRDKMIAEQVEQYNKDKRKDTLLEMHQSERKRKKKEEPQEDTDVRRPFDRDRDLQVNRFDDAQRKAVIKKSQKLNTRFSHGGSQFL